MNESLDKIRDAVRAEAEAEAAHILIEARAQLEALVEEAREEEEGKARLAVEAERLRLAQEEFREVSRAQRAARLTLLGARNLVVEGIFSRVREAALRMPAAAYRKLLRNWLSGVDAPEGGEVIPAARDAAVVGELVAELNRARPPEAAFSVSNGRAAFESGFIVRTPRFQVERSLEGWIAEQKRELAPRLRRELFGDAADADAR